MKLSYRDLFPAAPGRPAVVLHDRGTASVERVAGLARSSGAVGRVVAPFGDYGFTASGMELAGICWYRTVPGFARPDPVSLARAVVQVGDLLDDTGLDDPVLVGWGQGAAVALGAGLLRPDRVGPMVCIDAPAAHVEALPARLLATDCCPPVLVVRDAAGPTRDELGQGSPLGAVPREGGALADESTLAAHGIAATEWCCPDGDDEVRNEAMAERIGRWLGDD